MKIIMEKYIIVADGEAVKTYTDFKSAMWDVEFFQLMYKEVVVYQMILKNGDPV